MKNDINELFLFDLKFGTKMPGGGGGEPEEDNDKKDEKVTR